ncbi:SDR family oxidoreductase [Streptomyces sp. NPDC005498]|uniref:SDR family oxidoreductase n=1 Tax=Streptomyces sp. NPDC005498 TaxID=3364717 RepID=UPI0036C50D5D
MEGPAVSSVVVIGGTSGLGKEIARFYAGRGDEVILTGRDSARASAVAKEVGALRGIALDLSRPAEVKAALAEVGEVDNVVLVGVARDQNTMNNYDIEAAVGVVTMKLVGYTAVVHALQDRMHDDSAVVVFGGQAKERPYPGSITVSTINGGVTGLIRALAVEIAPIRVNAIHPGIIGDSPYWADKSLDAIVERTPIGRTASTADVVDAVDFLLHNRSINGVDLEIDGGWVLN